MRILPRRVSGMEYSNRSQKLVHSIPVTYSSNNPGCGPYPFIRPEGIHRTSLGTFLAGRPEWEVLVQVQRVRQDENDR